MKRNLRGAQIDLSFCVKKISLTKKITLFLIITFLCSSAVKAQSAKIDSLLKEIKTHPQNLSLKLELGISYLKKGNADSAETILTSVSKQALSSENFPIYIKSQTKIGTLYADKGENVNALRFYQNGLQIAESKNEKLLAAYILKHIGALYISWKKFDDALSYYEKAEKVASEIKETELIADCQNNKGTVFEQQKKYDQALTAYKNALNVYTEKKISSKISMALSNVAIVYKFQKNYPEAIKYNLKALALSTKSNDQWMMAATYNNIGNLYGEMGQYQKSIAYCNKALSIAKNIDALEIIESTYDSMSEAAAKAGDFKAAFEYHKLFSVTNSQFINAESTRQLSELNVKFETEKKQKLIQQQQFEISKRNYWLFGSFLLLFIVLILVYLVYKNSKHKQEKLLQQEFHKQQELASKALFEGEQKERIRIARDLHDSIGQMLAGLRMKLSGAENQDENLAIVDKTIIEVRNISHNLIPEALNFGLMSAIDDLADKLNTSGKINIVVNVLDDVRQHQFAVQDALSIYRIAQEVLTNVTKHANATKIRLEIKKVENKFVMKIEDDGKGFDVAKIWESNGLGWKNITARLNLIDGKIQVRSEKLVGTEIKIIIPA